MLVAVTIGEEVLHARRRNPIHRWRGRADHGDYHDLHWPDRVRAITGSADVSAAANATPGGATVAIRAVADGGRLATITSDPPVEERGIAVSSVYVRAGGAVAFKL